MNKELSKAYEAKQYEDEIYQKWLDSGFFNPDICIKKGICEENSSYFSIVLPPPNVTGTLHIGHAMMLAIQDLMVRYHRMKGDKTLWLPGTDHAAIATQTKVEKLLIEKGVKEPRKELGREKFLKEVEKFAQESHDIIVNQSKKMGSSLDWSREAFTLDEPRNLAVRTVFKKMYDDGLIYRGYRLVNWCPHCHSTIADDEVEHKEQKAKLYTFKYSSDFPIAIATTRPETKLGDTAVAVNPKDKRYKNYIGQELFVKAFAGGADLKIKIIGDETVDMSFGTGAVGVTPAHSFADYEMYKKHELDFVQVIDEDGKMTNAAGADYAGLPVKEARKKVVAYLQENNLLEKEEEVPNNLSVCYRCGYAIEPLPSKQWFIDVNKKIKINAEKLKNIKAGGEYSLKELMQTAVESGQIEIIPDRFNKVYFHWINNLRDWCISRQIWYGHRIPVWYKGEEIFVGVEAPSGDGWVQDSDTLDTWFSSGLWTFSTLGYPNLNADDLKNFHPTSVLETGYDILFFWVARMILMTTYVLGNIPFEKVYLHGLVRDEQGRKMSKSLGNVINPLDTIEKYGADATRLSLVLGNTPGNDVKLSEEKIAGFRNFTNKLWNISRFAQAVILSSSADEVDEAKDPSGSLRDSSAIPQNDKLTLADKWILSRLSEVIAEVTKAIDSYQFSLAGEKLRDFTWNELADWYLEIAKIEKNKSEILSYILSTILKLWHPFMPFVTEQIWQEIYGANKILMVEKWPSFISSASDKSSQNFEYNKESLKQFELIQSIITAIRSLRAENKIEVAKKLNVSIAGGDKIKLLEENREVIETLARLESLTISPKIEKLSNSTGAVVGGCEVFVSMEGMIDVSKEKTRLEAEIKTLEQYVVGLQAKLSNEEFVKNAPKAVIEKEQNKLLEAKNKLDKFKEQLSPLV